MHRPLSVSFLALSLAMVAPVHAEGWFRLNVAPIVFAGAGQDGGPPGGGVNDSISILVADKVEDRVYGDLSITVTVSGIDASYTVSVSGLPHGASWTPNGQVYGAGTISWPSASEGTYGPTVDVRNAAGLLVASSPFEIVIHPQLSAAVTSTAFEVDVGEGLTVSPTLSNSIGSVQWSAAPDPLPGWLALDENSGTITVDSAAPNYLGSIVLTAVDQADFDQAQTESFSIEVQSNCEWSNWTSRSAPAGTWNSVAYANGKFVAVGQNIAMTSADGITWTSRIAQAGAWASIAYGGGRFVAVATNAVMTSVDGVDWELRSSPMGSWNSVTYANGQFVAVGYSATTPVMTSPDGLNWTARSAPSTVWRSVTFAAGRYVAVGTNQVMTSADGVAWVSGVVPTGNWGAVVNAKGQLVAVGYGGTSRVMTSPDGINWTPRTSPMAAWYSVAHSGDQFVSVGNASTSMSSSDGILWASEPSPAGPWLTVIYGNDRLVAAGTNGVITSDCH